MRRSPSPKSCVIVRQVPADVDAGDIPAMLISAVGVLIPVALLVMLGLVFISRLLLNLL